MHRQGGSWNKPEKRNSNQPRRPPGLKGKEIGLYYKNLNKNKETRGKKELVVKLSIPPKIVNQIQNKLLNIETSLNINNQCCSTKSNPREKETSMSNKGGGFKYGYNDIVTDTFQEKLEKCLFNNTPSINESTLEINDLNIALQEDYKNMVDNAQYKNMMAFRKKLPAFIKSKELLDAINSNQVIVISGETGCGKSTQVPQMILDEAINNSKGANTKILVTQPRRIAASSLAARVAAERAENVGNSVGCVVRLEKVEPRSRGSILFCTTGILLADLEVDQALSSYSHIILDEVHERDCHIDLSMCMLKEILQKRKDLKLILMSATLDAESISAYYNDCPSFHIEGLAYPVKDVYLEDILELTRFSLPDEQYKHPPRYKWPKKHNNITEKDIQYKCEIGPWLESKKHSLSRDVYKTLSDSRIEELNIPLILELVKYICRGDPGAILVFVPGLAEITSLLRAMEESQTFPSSRYEIHPLHSKLPSLEQHRIFQKPPSHIRKIIVATNIAETSITIDDIVYVIDTAKIKISGLNVEENVSTLQIEWVAQANLRQRRGRAGRCQPGVCYHMLTSYRAGKLLERHPPELQRSNLLEPVLTVKRLRLGKAAEAFRKVPACPAESTVDWAVKHLQRCGALDGEEKLTPLGWHLARLPVHPAAGKLLILGALFGCLDRAASVAAVWSFKDPFMLVIGKESEVDRSKKLLSLDEPSDHVAISEAIMTWERLNSRSEKRSFAYEHFLSNNTLELLSNMKNQFGDNLNQMGFLSSRDLRSQWENRNSENFSLFKAVIAASLYPSIGNVRWLGLDGRNLKKGVRITVRTPEDGKACIHPGSVMSKNISSRNAGAGWLVYWLKQRSTQLFLIDVTLVSTLPLLFFGELIISPVEDDPDYCFMLISNVKVKCLTQTAHLLVQLRNYLDQVLASKVMNTNPDSIGHSHFDENVLNAVIELITAEDEQAQCLGEFSDSDESDYGSSRRNWR